MALRTLPGLGLSGFWDLGAEYKDAMDANLRLLSALVQAGAKSKDTNLPATPARGDIYIVPAGAAENANALAIWDGETGAEAWVYVTPAAGWSVYVADIAAYCEFDGTAWVPRAGGPTTFTALADTPADYNGQGGKFLAVKADASGVEFVAAPAGGGGGGVPEAPVDGNTYARKDGGWVAFVPGEGSGGGGGVTYNPFLYHGEQGVPSLATFPDNRSVGSDTPTITEETNSLRLIGGGGAETDRTMLTKNLPANWHVVEFGFRVTAAGAFDSAGAVIMGASGDFVTVGTSTGSGGISDPEFRILEWAASGAFQTSIFAANTTGGDCWVRLVRSVDQFGTEHILVFQAWDGKAWTYRGVLVSGTVLGGNAAYVGVTTTKNTQIDLFYYADEDTIPGFVGFASGGGGGGGGGASAFTDLTDAPSDYTNQAGKVVKVKATEDGIEFADESGGISDAAADGNFYARKDGAWAAISQVNGASTIEEIIGFDINRTLLTAQHTGQAPVWDADANAFVMSPPGFDALRLGGGVELIHEVSDLNGWAGVTLDEGTYNIDDYDEIIGVLSGSNIRLSLQISSDGGTTAASIINRRVNQTDTNTYTDTTVYIGSSVNENANTSATFSIRYHSMTNVETVFSMEGGGEGTANAGYQWTGQDSTARRTNAIMLAPNGTITGGTLRILGVKKSRQPIEMNGAITGGAWSASQPIATHPTMGVKFRAGVAGKVMTDVNATAAATVNIKTLDGTTIATATVPSGSNSADIVFAGDTSVTEDVVRIEAAESAATTGLGAIYVALRGETA